MTMKTRKQATQRIYEAVKQIPYGHVVQVTDGRVDLKKYQW